jgi:hypothetical protein
MQYRIAVGIPTVGRAPMVRELLRELARQTRRPESVTIGGTKLADIEGIADVSPGVRALLGRAGTDPPPHGFMPCRARSIRDRAYIWTKVQWHELEISIADRETSDTIGRPTGSCQR